MSGGQPRVFRGWRIVAVAALAQSLAVGTTFFAYGVFVKPLAAEFEAPRLAVVLGLTGLMLVQGIASPWLGRLLDVWSVRGVMSAGVLVCAAGFLGLSYSTALWQVGVLFGTLIAVGSHMFGTLATSTLVANWFVRRRGQALGITSIGASVGGLVFPMLVAGWIAEIGWRGAAATLAGVLVVFAAPLWLLVVDRPERVGLHPDGDATAASGDEAAPGTPPESADAQPANATATLLASRNFWVVTITIGLVFCPTSAVIAHLVPYASDLGHDPQRAALLMSAYAGAGAIGRLWIGALADRVEKRLACWIVLAVILVAWAALVAAPSYPTLLLASIGLGLSVGGIMPLWGALTGACFGRAMFGRAMGLMTPLMLPFNLAGAPVAAWAFDRTGSYTLVLSVFGATFVASALVVAFLRVPRVEPT